MKAGSLCFLGVLLEDQGLSTPTHPKEVLEQPSLTCYKVLQALAHNPGVEEGLFWRDL